ncbi:MAG: MBL fold metallo-hydrolase [Pseudorhodoplanes sp.]|nr:MBL fold metallo-hydrolase [Pseudorhodoplanes sp.]
MTLTFTILGCGSSGGVPRPALGWGVCDPNNPRNRRRRCSLLIERAGEHGKTIVLIDTSPDLREQLLDAGVNSLDAVLYTHDHADHTHGIDDLRPFFIHRRQRIDAYLDEPTSRSLHAKFGYCFASPPGSEYPPILSEHRLIAGQPATIEGEGGAITALPLIHQHGDMPALGFRIGNVAYSPDLNGMPEDSIKALSGLDLWIVDALRHKRHPSHFSLTDALTWIERLKPKEAILTNLHADLDYEATAVVVPRHVRPAYDGLKITTGD